MKRLSIAIFAFMGILLLAADWPRFRGPDGNGVSSEKGLPLTWSDTENVTWKTELPGPGTSSPVFLGDRIFLTCYTGYNVPGKPQGEQEDLRLHVLSLDRKSGRLLWDKEVKPRLPEQSRIRDGHGYASSTPAVDAERVYCFFGKTGVIAFDHDGKQLWQTEVGSGLNGWGSAASPILHGDLVLVNASVESQSLVALDKKTGKERWRLKGIRESWSTPILAKNKEGKTELLVPIFGKILGIDPDAGEILWSCANNITWYMVPGMVAHDGIVYAIGGRSGVAALAVRMGGKGDVTATHRLWTSTKGSNVSSPVYHQGHLYYASDSTGTAYCAKADTGEVVYQQRLPRADTIYASSLLADGRIHYLCRNGRTFVVAAKPEYELLATNDLRDRSIFNATPVAIDGRLFLRSDRYLYCLERK